jgi:hypothetical protein
MPGKTEAHPIDESSGGKHEATQSKHNNDSTVPTTQTSIGTNIERTPLPTHNGYKERWPLCGRESQC